MAETFGRKGKEAMVNMATIQWEFGIVKSQEKEERDREISHDYEGLCKAMATCRRIGVLQ